MPNPAPALITAGIVGLAGLLGGVLVTLGVSGAIEDRGGPVVLRPDDDTSEIATVDDDGDGDDDGLDPATWESRDTVVSRDTRESRDAVDTRDTNDTRDKNDTNTRDTTTAG